MSDRDSATDDDVSEITQRTRNKPKKDKKKSKNWKPPKM